MRKGRKGGPRELRPPGAPQAPQLCSTPSQAGKPRSPHRKVQQSMTNPIKRLQVGLSLLSPRSHTSPAPPPPGGTNPNPRSPACQCLRGRGLCAVSNRSLGATSLELSLHPCAVLGGGVDGGPATRAGLLLPRLLVIGLWRLKVHSLSRWELLEGRGPW